jgi:hypothetical protein
MKIASVKAKMIHDNLDKPAPGSTDVIICGGTTNPIAIPI